MPLFSTLCDDCGEPGCPACGHRVDPATPIPLNLYAGGATFRVSDAEVQLMIENTAAIDSQIARADRAFWQGVAQKMDAEIMAKLAETA